MSAGRAEQPPRLLVGGGGTSRGRAARLAGHLEFHGNRPSGATLAPRASPQDAPVSQSEHLIKDEVWKRLR